MKTKQPTWQQANKEHRAAYMRWYRAKTKAAQTGRKSRIPAKPKLRRNGGVK